MHSQLYLTVRSFRSAAFFSAILLCFSLSSYAQPETVATFGRDWGGLYGYKVYGNKLLAVLGKQYRNGQVRMLDLNTRQFESASDTLFYQNNLAFSGQGVFSTSTPVEDGWEQGYYLNFTSYTGQTFRYGPVATGGFLNLSAVCADRYYVADENEVWECDGTNEGTRIAFTLPVRPFSMTQVGDQLMISVVTSDSILLYRYLYGSGLSLFASFSRSQYILPSAHVAGTDSSHAYFQVYDRQAEQYSLYQTDLTPAGTRLFLENLWVNKIYFDNPSFMLIPYGAGYLKVSLQNPSQVDTLRIARVYADPTAFIGEVIAPRTMVYVSAEKGIELATLTPQDSIALWQDFVPGPDNSLYCYANGYKCQENGRILVDETQAVYTILTNGNDPYYYIYQVKEGVFTSLVRLSDPEGASRFYKAGEDLYWLDTQSKVFRIQRMSPGAARDIQPLTPSPNPDTWYRQVGSSLPGHYNCPDQMISAKDVFTDEEGNIYTGYSDASYLSVRLTHSSRDTTREIVKGTELFVKYDKYGTLLWVNSIGDNEGIFRYPATFTLDDERNLIVWGDFTEKARFDGDSLESPRVGQYIAKLDGQTGFVLWKKLFSTGYYISTIQPEKIVTDEENRIYISFMYSNFAVALENTTLTSQISPVNAVACLAPDGTLLWAKNIQTPWTDKYGYTRVLQYHPGNQTLMVVQSQGYYNTWSSCEFREWKYYLQTLDRSGNLLDVYEINSTDLGSITAGAFSESGRFIGAGYYRGRMDLGKFAFDSPQARECSSDAGFTFAYDPELDEVRAASTTILAGEAFYPTDMKVYQGHVYYLGTANRGELTLLKYTEDGYIVGYKRLGQYANVFDFEYDNYFDVRDGYIVLSGTNYVYDAATGVNPLITHCNSLSVLKIEDKDWVREGDWLLAQLPDPDVYGASPVVYPNPFRGTQVRVVFGENAQPFTRYELFTLLGQSLGSGTLDIGESIQELTLPELKPGTYLMRFSGSQQVKTVKVIREP